MELLSKAIEAAPHAGPLDNKFGNLLFLGNFFIVPYTTLCSLILRKE
jgi:hypothetical protein